MTIRYTPKWPTGIRTIHDLRWEDDDVILAAMTAYIDAEYARGVDVYEHGTPLADMARLTDAGDVWMLQERHAHRVLDIVYAEDYAYDPEDAYA